MHVVADNTAKSESNVSVFEEGIVSGQKMGITLRTHLSPLGREVIVSREVGMQIVALLLDDVLEQQEIAEAKLSILQAGGQQQIRVAGGAE